MKKAIVIFVVCCFVAAFADNPHITKLIELVDVAISSPADGDLLSFDASTGKWSNKQPVAPVIPDTSRVVLRYQQENIRGGINATLFTPDETGSYRFNMTSSSLPQLGQCSELLGGSASLTFDDGTTFSRIPIAIITGGQGEGIEAQSSGIIRATSGSPITINLGATSCPYNLYVVVEKL
jgi:hypothetical protein